MKRRSKYSLHDVGQRYVEGKLVRYDGTPVLTQERRPFAREFISRVDVRKANMNNNKVRRRALKQKRNSIYKVAAAVGVPVYDATEGRQFRNNNKY